MTPESRNIEDGARRILLDNGSVIVFPLQQEAVIHRCLGSRTRSRDNAEDTQNWNP
jgi:hypothetical protein